ncbi:hypothetical protein LSTR_LSTR001529 [Laodelphax striatellus]|uniref:Uncharacterized protein n=1 Tax=Laodelphax striatellus TaxID=195883 RepID=A0A482XCQ3_LAOST|nr:hypothetical protein LSTR_LSTR001529 [Laodelphax striatellus]
MCVIKVSDPKLKSSRLIMTLITKRSVNLSSSVGPVDTSHFVFFFFLRTKNEVKNTFRYDQISYDMYRAMAVNGQSPGTIAIAQYTYVINTAFVLYPTRIGTPHLVGQFIKRHGIPAPEFVLCTAYQGNITAEWVEQMHLEAQAVSKALFSYTEDGALRRVQFAGKTISQYDLLYCLVAPTFQLEGYAFSISTVIARLSTLGVEMVDAHLIRALVAGAVPEQKIRELFRDVAFDAKFRVGELYLDGTFYVAPEDHVLDINGWSNVSKGYSGVLLDVGNPVLLRSGRYHDHIASNVVMSWCHRIVHSKLFGGALFDDFDTLTMIDMSLSLYKLVLSPSNKLKAVLWAMLLSCSLSREEWVEKLMTDDKKLASIVGSLDSFCDECANKFLMLGCDDRDLAALPGGLQR